MEYGASSEIGVWRTALAILNAPAFAAALGSLRTLALHSIHVRSSAIRVIQEAIPTRIYRRAHVPCGAVPPDRRMAGRKTWVVLNRSFQFADAVIARRVGAAPWCLSAGVLGADVSAASTRIE
ncbi:hypothetical protein BJ912DRAFT_1056590 [Pholiota molesta]|nr:hypothetical protein BJ912DRAFT_1056590 [Pholiota molesta]